MKCLVNGCQNEVHGVSSYCRYHRVANDPQHPVPRPVRIEEPLAFKADKFFMGNPEDIKPQSLAEKYPQYYKSLNGMTVIDVYGVHQIFEVQDHSGSLQHASKKILLSGVRTGKKTKYQDIKEARDALDRWLQLNPETK